MESPLITRTSPTRDDVFQRFRAEKHATRRARYQAIFLLLDGHSVQEVTTIVGKSKRTIYYWAAHFNARGFDGLKSKPIPGRTPRLTFAQYLELEEDFTKHPSEFGYDFANWDGKRAAWHIEQKFGVKLKVRRVEYLFHELGLSLQRPRPRSAKADPVKQAAFRQDLQKKVTTAPLAPTT